MRPGAEIVKKGLSYQRMSFLEAICPDYTRDLSIKASPANELEDEKRL